MSNFKIQRGPRPLLHPPSNAHIVRILRWHGDVIIISGGIFCESQGHQAALLRHRDWYEDSLWVARRWLVAKWNVWNEWWKLDLSNENTILRCVSGCTVYGERKPQDQTRMLRFFKDICAGILLMELPYPSNISGKKMGVIGNCGSLVFWFSYHYK